MQHDLFAHERGRTELGPGAAILDGFAKDISDQLVQEVIELSSHSPFRHMETRGGKRMSVAMLNCGPLGWVSDRQGYRYTAIDPVTRNSWPSFPSLFLELAERAASEVGFKNFVPDACLINRYCVGSKLSLHQDMDEQDRIAPIVSISLGLPAIFLWGGQTRNDRLARHQLFHGDVVVWGGASRMVFHGIDTLKDGEHPLTGHFRFNLTFRKVR